MSRPLIIRNGVVALPSGPSRSDILCRDGRIVAIGNGLNAPEAEVVNAAALTIGPGFVDVHVHGGGGHAFLTHDQFRIRDYAAWAPRNGVTSFLVSTVGRDAADTVEIFAALRPAIHSTSGAEPLGFHPDGPFINPPPHRASRAPPGGGRDRSAAPADRGRPGPRLPHTRGVGDERGEEVAR